MADSTTTKLFIFVITFWTILAMFTYAFQDYLGGEALGDNINCYLTTNDYAKQDVCNKKTSANGNVWDTIKGFADNILNVANEIPVVNLFVPLARIITFSYSTNVHVLLRIFLSGFMIFTGYIVYSLIRG